MRVWLARHDEESDQKFHADVPDKAVALGRCPFLQVTDTNVPRRLADLEITDGNEIRLVSKHDKKPIFYWKNGSNQCHELADGNSTVLRSGDRIGLTKTDYIYVVNVEKPNDVDTQLLDDTQLIQTVDVRLSPNRNNALADTQLVNSPDTNVGTATLTQEYDDARDNSTTSSTKNGNATASNPASPTVPSPQPTIIKRRRVLPESVLAMANGTSPLCVKLEPKRKKDTASKPKTTKADKQSSDKSDKSDSEEKEKGKKATSKKKEPATKKPRKTRKRKSSEEEEEDYDTDLSGFIVSDKEEDQADTQEKKKSLKKGRRLPAVYDYADDEDYVPNKDGSEDDDEDDEEELAKMAKKKDDGSNRRAPCWYGTKCYRKNPAHKTQFAHPGDDDYRDPVSSGESAESSSEGDY